MTKYIRVILSCLLTLVLAASPRLQAEEVDVFAAATYVNGPSGSLLAAGIAWYSTASLGAFLTSAASGDSMILSPDTRVLLVRCDA